MPHQHNKSLHTRHAALLAHKQVDERCISLLMEAFQKFSQASGLWLIVRRMKCIWPGLMIRIRADSWVCQGIGMSAGDFSFKYLGVPLHSKKLITMDCRGLVGKITTKLHTWQAKLLSYTGRLELVKSVIGGMQNFWLQLFCFPKKVMKQISSVCTRFVWTHSSLGGKKNLLAWDSLCFPKAYWCLNLIVLEIWNKATILRLLQAIDAMKDRLLIK